MKPVIAITMGDPAGVGPEIVLRALSTPSVRRISRPLVIGDAGILTLAARRLGIPGLPQEQIINLSNLDTGRLTPGRPTKAASRAAVAYIEEAVYMARRGDAAAIVTAPVNKAALKKVGFRHPGHTEFIAELTGTKSYRMMLGGPRLKVVLVTIHEPLKRVPKIITKERILETIKITDRSFKRYFGVRSPKIAVTGLNPHAGEGGLFGEEEKRFIRPAVVSARRGGVDATGPLPADTVFYRAAKGDFHCVVSMYHDQGLGPLKLLHFDDGVNVTLGLPIIRTSVDHGTAYDIAWKGRASAASMTAAIKTAVEMALNRSK